MSNEMIVHEGADNGDLKHNPDRTLVGKIARLPKEIREELNQRLEDNQPASEILPWVNGLPATIEILAKYFRGMPISDANLSQWKRVGYKRWQEKQESFDELKWLGEDAGDFFEAAGGNMARIAVMKIMKMIQAIPATPESLDGLAKISYAVSALLNTDQNQTRLEYEKTRVFQGNERLVLSWDKFLRGCIDTAQRALTDQIAKDIQAADIDNGEKIELLGHHMFGRKWKGRILGKKEEMKKESTQPEKAEEKKTDAQERAHACVPTTGQAHCMEPEKKDVHQSNEPAAGEKTDPKRMDATQRAHACVPTAIQGDSAEVKALDDVKDTDVKVSGGLPTAATKPAVELSPYEKAIREGKTHLEAMYAQYSSVKNP